MTVNNAQPLLQAGYPPLGSNDAASQPAMLQQKHVVSVPVRTQTKSLDDGVSLSHRARHLAGNDQTGQADPLAGQGFDMAQQLLGSLTQHTLSLLGVVNGNGAGQATIQFDSLSYDTSESSSLSVGQQTQSGQGGSVSSQTSAQFAHSQQLDFHGHGTITTADGRHFTFDASLEIAVASASQQSVSNQTTDGQGGKLDFGGTAAQLLDQLRPQDSATPVALVQHGSAQTPASVVPGGLKLALKDNQGQLLGHIDWQKLLSGLQAFVGGLDQAASEPTQQGATKPS
jgi:hypothetical protein